MVDLKVGDEVRVFDINGRRMGQPDGGWQGTVTKVGRTLVYVDYGHRNGQFRIDTGRANDSYGHRYFKTLEQAASDARLSHALARLKGGPVRLESGHRLTVEQIERLADLVASFTKET